MRIRRTRLATERSVLSDRVKKTGARCSTASLATMSSYEGQPLSGRLCSTGSRSTGPADASTGRPGSGTGTSSPCTCGLMKASPAIWSIRPS